VAHILVLDELSKILELHVQDIGNQKALKKGFHVSKEMTGNFTYGEMGGHLGPISIIQWKAAY